MKIHHAYYVYMLHCADGSYYTGVTNNIERRFEEHNLGLDSKCYTFSRRPLVLKYAEFCTDINYTIAREKQIKRWSRRKKEALINERYDELIKYSRRKERSD